MKRIRLWNRSAFMVFAATLAPILVAQANQAQDYSEHYMETMYGKTHLPAEGAAGKKTAQLSARVTITNRRGPPGNLAGVQFELRDLNGKINAARIVVGPAKVKQPQPGQVVAEFDVAVYDFAPQPRERYMFRGTFPSGRAFGRPVRFEKSAEPLPEEPWEKEATEKPNKTARPKKGRK